MKKDRIIKAASMQLSEIMRLAYVPVSHGHFHALAVLSNIRDALDDNKIEEGN